MSSKQSNEGTFQMPDFKKNPVLYIILAATLGQGGLDLNSSANQTQAIQEMSVAVVALEDEIEEVAFSVERNTSRYERHEERLDDLEDLDDRIVELDLRVTLIEHDKEFED